MDTDYMLEEYKICLEHASRLESYIWQTASLLSIGSAVGIISVAIKLSNKVTDPESYCILTIFAAILAINLSFVWWRFAKRWWSIQKIAFERMRELEEILGFKETKMVREWDKSAMKRINYLKNCRYYKKIRYWIFYHIPKETPTPYDKPNIDKIYEYRGVQSVARLLVFTNILLWLSLVIFSFTKLQCWWNFIRDNYIGISFLIIIWFGGSLYFWRDPSAKYIQKNKEQ